MTEMNSELLLNDYARYLRLANGFGRVVAEKYQSEGLKPKYFGDEINVFWFSDTPGDLFRVFKRKNGFFLRDLTWKANGFGEFDTISWNLRDEKSDTEFVDDAMLLFDTQLDASMARMKRHWAVQRIKADANIADEGEFED